jgi:DNA-binding CsgD family transcriptional regulator
LADAVVGREPELRALRGFLAAARPLPGALVLEGDAGIGKTTLWRAGIEIAGEAGQRVLRCQPAVAESQLAFAALSDLLAGALDDALPALPPPQRRALEIALLLAEPGGAPPDIRALAAACLGVIRQLTAHSTVVVAIDDVQWLDAPSRTVLEFAVRRLASEPVALLLATRGVGREPPLGLERALPADRLERLPVTGISIGALHRLLHARLGTALPRPLLRRVHAESGGNPFYALELGRALKRHGAMPRPDESLPVPDTLAQLVQDRVAALPDRVRALLELVAALYDRSVDAVRRLAVSEGLGGAIDEAVAAGILAVGGGAVQFTHPLLATGVYSDMGPERRREVHRRLIDRDRRYEASTVHLALAAAGPDANVAAELDDAAARARARGAAASAGRYAEQAAHLTPPEDLPGSARRTVAAADHYAIAGDPARARELLNELIERLEPGPARAEALSLLAWNAPDGADLTVAAQLGEQALAEAAAGSRLQAVTQLRLGVIEEIRGRQASSLRHRQAAVALGEQIGDPTLMALALSAVGYAATMDGQGVAEESRRAAEIEATLPGFLGQYSPAISLGQTLMYSGELDEARLLLEQSLERATAAGHEDARCTCLFHLADLERRAGNWVRARAFSDETRELNLQAGNEQEYASCLVVGALLDAGMGDLAAASAAATIGLAAAEAMGDATFTIQHRGVLGFAALSAGDAEQALEWLGPASDAMIGQRIREPSIYPVLHNEFEAAVEAGEVQRAELLVAHLEALAAETERPWTVAMARRGRGLILASHGDLEASAAILIQAAADAETLGQPLELGRALLALGRIERRAKRKRTSRDALDRAAVIFEALPAPLWAARAREELARLGLRSAPGGLTETEARIAELAASGLTNPEIAAAVFVSRKTVEANLSKVYRKLGVRSRVELARALPPPEP